MTRRTLALSGILALLLTAPGAFAAQSGADTKSDVDDILERIQREKYFLSGNFERKRDPFTFRKPQRKSPVPQQPPKPETPEKREKLAKREKPDPLLVIRAALEDATAFLAADQPKDAAAAARDGLSALERAAERIEKSRRFGLNEKLDRVRIAAERQIRRRATEGRFEKLALKLNGILYIESRPQALINADVYHEGQIVKGARIRRIERDHVVFEFEGLPFRRRLPKPDVKRG